MKQNIRTKYFIELGVNSVVPEQSITVYTNTSTGINSGAPEQSLAVETNTFTLTPLFCRNCNQGKCNIYVSDRVESISSIKNMFQKALHLIYRKRVTS